MIDGTPRRGNKEIAEGFLGGAEIPKHISFIGRNGQEISGDVVSSKITRSGKQGIPLWTFTLRNLEGRIFDVTGLQIKDEWKFYEPLEGIKKVDLQKVNWSEVSRGGLGVHIVDSSESKTQAEPYMENGILVISTEQLTAIKNLFSRSSVKTGKGRKFMSDCLKKFNLDFKPGKEEIAEIILEDEGPNGKQRKNMLISLEPDHFGEEISVEIEVES